MVLLSFTIGGIMVLKDMGQKETASRHTPIERFPKVIHKPEGVFFGDVVNHKTHRVYDSMKHVSHNRNHTLPGVGRHS